MKLMMTMMNRLQMNDDLITLITQILTYNSNNSNDSDDNNQEPYQ